MVKYYLLIDNCRYNEYNSIEKVIFYIEIISNMNYTEFEKNTIFLFYQGGKYYGKIKKNFINYPRNTNGDFNHPNHS